MNPVVRLAAMAKDKEMTILDTIRDLKDREPFEPFRIVLTSGAKYLIESGENLVFMQSQLFYGYPRSDKFVFLRMNQIAAVEQFQEKPAA